jgi:UDP-N-acetylglucosamine 2-epimerase (non-hydrolysing)
MESRARINVAFVLGTRPEAVKLSSLIAGARANPERFGTYVVSTGQHREMLDGMLEWFDIQCDVDLHIMQNNQRIRETAVSAISGLDSWLSGKRIDWVIVQGDTTTTLAGALAAFYHQIPVAHVEAGLRTTDRYSPFPEEMNRRLITQIASVHFAATNLARDNLLREGVAEERILVTGNTGIDALLWTSRKLGVARRTGVRSQRILVTSHRRENHGEPLERICDALVEILQRFPDVLIQYPMHPSPKVREIVIPRLGHLQRVELTEPLDYPRFVEAMARADLILSDSGGVQEEAPYLGTPVLILRDSTERPEAIHAGMSQLIGTDKARIVAAVEQVLRRPAGEASGIGACNLYGDGDAADKILAFLADAQTIA